MADPTVNVPDDAPFEELVLRLREVVDNLEQGELSLEDALSRFEQGVRLSRLGQQRLDEAERRVEELLSNEREVTTRTIEED